MNRPCSGKPIRVGYSRNPGDSSIRLMGRPMPKQAIPQPDGRPAGRQALRGAARREVAAEAPAGSRPRAGQPADLRRLAAEVERLEGELAGMREKLRELEARADIDPLTDVFNRRG